MNYDVKNMMAWVKGNDVLLDIYLYEWVDEQTRQAFNLQLSDNVKVRLVNTFGRTFDIEALPLDGHDNGLVIDILGVYPCGTYSLEITLVRGGRHVRSFESPMFRIVERNADANMTFDIVSGGRRADTEIEMQVVANAVARGKNAYELAVEQGYEGTLGDWLADIVHDADYVHTDNNFTDEYKQKVDDGMNVPEWALQPTKPTYTPEEVGAPSTQEFEDAVQDLEREKQDTLVSGENIKTVNGKSLVGSGNVTIASGVQSDWDEDDTESLAYINNKPSVYTQAQTNALLSGKQDKLISGQNIKTINGNSMVGDGNLIITGETVVVDGYPTKDSMNPVASGGVYDALESESVTQDVTLSAGYISLQSNIGKTISTDITVNSYYVCAAVEVHQGDTVVMSGTDFNATIHLWGFLDTDKVLLSKSDGNNTKYTDLTMVVENDGWLVYNSLASNTANSLKITSTTKRNAFKSGQEIKEVSIVEGYEGGEDDVLSAATGAELNSMINKTIDHTSSIVSGYFNMNGLTVGSTLREEVLSNSYYACAKIAVEKGDVAVLTGTTSNATVRLYCVTDKENKILQIISSTYHIYVKEEVDITEDGFLYYSSTSANSANEILIVKSADSRLTNLEKSVNEIMRISPAMDVEDIYAADKKMRDLMRANANVGFFFFSDVHRSETNAARILALANAWAAEGKVDAVLNGGDAELENIGTSSSPVWSFEWFTDLMDACDIDVLSSIGNHDSAPYSGNPLSSFESDYIHIIAPQVSRYENIIQPTGASTNNLSYFYKDYNGVRVINFDTAYNWGDGTQEEEAAYLAAEISWLASVLADARTNSKAVIIFTHYAFLANKSTTPDGCTFKTFGWDNAGESISESILTAVDDFINAGGTFVCWLTGHSHHDIFLKSTEHPSQCMVNIGSARYNNNGPNNIHRMVTTDQTTSDYDQFAYVTVDKERGLLSVMKMGSRIDKQLISRTSFVYDYINQTMVSNES